jgi:hypothetical protein
MEYIYNAYLKEVDGKTFYFVKKLSVFPEYESCPPVLESMGMHADFFKACSIAKIYEQDVITKLMNEVHLIPDSAKVIHLNKAKAISNSLIKNTQQAILKLKLASLG